VNWARKAVKDIMLIKPFTKCSIELLNVQVSDTRGDDSSNAAGKKNIKQPIYTYTWF